MKHLAMRSLFALTLGSTCLSAYAAPQSPGLHFALTAGLTGGGDEIVTVQYSNHSSRDIRAGNLIELGAGVLYQSPDAPISAQLTANYHFDYVPAKNGNASFDRYPIEGIVYYTGVSNWRLGAGLRLTLNPTAKYSFDNGDNFKATFDNTVGYLVEVGYAVTPQLWINLRGVHENYRVNHSSVNGVDTTPADKQDIHGDHIGINMVIAF